MAELVWRSQPGRDGLVEKQYRCRCGGNIWGDGWWDTECDRCHRPHTSWGDELRWDAPHFGHNGFGGHVDVDGGDW